MELLNLDDLVKVNREVQIGGETYEISDQTVGQMVDALRTAKAIEENQDDNELILNSMIETAGRLIPKCPKEIIEQLKMRQLSALIEFASTSDEDVVADAEVEVAEGNPAEKTNP